MAATDCFQELFINRNEVAETTPLTEKSVVFNTWRKPFQVAERTIFLPVILYGCKTPPHPEEDTDWKGFRKGERGNIVEFRILSLKKISYYLGK